MPREPWIAVLSALVLAAAVAWLSMSTPGPIVLPAADRTSRALAIAALRPPAIGGFEQYDVNADNPFVPYHDRIRPVAPPPPATGWIPPRPEPVLPEPAAPPLHLPAAQPGGGDAPRVVGFVRGGDLAAGVHAILPGRPPVRMRIGERIGRWTLQAIESGSLAVFADEAGRQYRLVIGER